MLQTASGDAARGGVMLGHRLAAANRVATQTQDGFMTTSAEPTDAPPSTDDSAWHKFAAAFGLLWLADILFYDQPVGLSMTLFASALLAGCALVNHDRIDRRGSILAAGIFVAGLLPAIEALTPLSVLILVLTTITAVALSTDPVASGLWLPVTAARQLLLTGPFRLFP